MGKSSKEQKKMSTKRLVCLILAVLMVLGSITTLIYFIVQNAIS